MTLTRKLLAEGIGTLLLLAIVIGSGIMAERLAGGNMAIALLANTISYDLSDEAVDIDVPQIKRWLAFGDPMRERHARAAA